jgi:VWFA-related protein
MPRLLVIALCIAAVSQTTAQQQPAPSFRAGVDAFTLEASVADGTGTPITDLAATDFTVTVNGKPRRVRTVRYHGYEGADADARAAAPLLPAAVANTSASGRIVVFVVDRDSIAPGSERVIFDSAKTLIDGLTPADAAGLFELPGASTDLTRDHARVRNALMRVTGSRPPSMMERDYEISWDEALGYERRDAMTIQRVVERECPNVKQPSATGGGTAETLRNPCPPALELQALQMLQIGRTRTQSVLANLSTIVKQLEPLRGTKQLVLLSSGFPWSQDLMPAFDRFTRQVAASQVMFYALHLGEPGADVASRRVLSTPMGGSDYMTGMATIATQTGGAFYQPSGSGAGVFERIRTALNNFYELGVEFEAGDSALEEFTVEVKVARAGASVRHRRRVVPPARIAAGGDPLSDLLRQPTDLGEVPLAVSAYTMRGDEASMLRTIVGLDAGSALDRGPAEWGFSVFSEGNMIASGRQRVDGQTGPWTAALSAKLVPGRYRLRAGLIDATGRAGVVERDLDVGLRGTPSAQFSDLLTGVADANGRLQPSSRIRKGVQLSMLVEVVSADPATLESVKTVLEIVPGGTATPIKKFVMGARSGTSPAILNNQAEVATTDLPVGRYTAIATPTIGEQALGKVTRIFQIVDP